MLEKMLFTIPKGKHSAAEIRNCLLAHPEIQYVSLMGLDIYGNDTDEKVPIRLLLEDIDGFMRKGMQTDGSSVLLPGIADICNGRVDLIPDKDVNWYVDYNYYNIDEITGLPVGTLRIPAFLLHNGVSSVGSRIILKRAMDVFKLGIMDAMSENPYIFNFLPFDSVDDIAELKLTSATELEFYVKTPHEVADRERLHTSQEMKEQYWKRTIGPVRTALEKTLRVLDSYVLGVEMGHMEVGGVNPEMNTGGDFGHIMEQLEIDWKYADPMQAADNDKLARNVVKDVFRFNGLDVTFMAKPVDHVAGSGKHTHFGVAAKLKDGRMVNLFSAIHPEKDFLSPIGFGALMGMLKNYEVVAPMVSNSNDSFNRLKPGYEAPVCVVTSLGRSIDAPSRNRTVLAGLIRDNANPLATRFELRSPNPKSNTYLVVAAGLLAMLDGIRAALKNRKTSAALCESISKSYGKSDFYLETERMYRVENDIFTDYSEEDRERLFGGAPRTVWEAMSVFNELPEETEVLREGNAFTEEDLESYRLACIGIWATELRDRLVPAMRSEVWSYKKLHTDENGTDLDTTRWKAIEELRNELAKDSVEKLSILSLLTEAIDSKNYDDASKLQLIASEKAALIKDVYTEYCKNVR